MKHIKSPKNVNMKKLFRRNQIIITTLAVMIAAAGYLNYAGKKEVASADPVYEAGMMEISDEDILAENQAMLSKNDDNLQEIPSWDVDLEEAESVAQTAAPNPRPRERAWPMRPRERKPDWKIREKQFSPAV